MALDMKIDGNCLLCGTYLPGTGFIVFRVNYDGTVRPIHLECALKELNGHQ